MSTRAAAGEKHGNTAWLPCPRCSQWFPVAPAMLEATAPACVCPACHEQFKPDRRDSPAP